MTKTIRILAALSLVALSIGLGACGGDDESEEPSAAAETEQQAETPTAAEEAEAEPEADSGGGVAEPGTELSVGDSALVKFKPLVGEGEFELDVAVKKLEKRSLDDLEGIQLDADQKTATPYFVTVSVTNPGEEDVPVKDNDPDVRFDGIDDRGQEQTNVIIIGDFPPCEDKEAPKPFAKGESYESCLIYLIPGGGTLDAVQWTGADEYISEPVVWK